ncbi:MAG TPA: TorF family putative porin [Xanthomonadales bacterium]|nr:TorF family putative porin [Xanthomonadales bacterium]
MRALALVVCAAAAACGEARAQQLHAYAAIASDHVDRGVALGGGAPLLQLGIERTGSSGVVAGAFATTLDRAWTRDRAAASSEVDAYLGYDFGCGGACRARVLATRYVFPGRRDADWTEWSVALAPHPRFGASLAHSGHVYALSFPGTTLEAWYEQPLSTSWTLGVSAGRIRTRFFDYGYGRVGATWRRGRLAFDVSYHAADPEYRDNGFSDDLQHLVATLTWAH